MGNTPQPQCSTACILSPPCLLCLPAHTRVQFTQSSQENSTSALNQVHHAHVTLGRGRGKHCSFLLESAGLVPLRDIR